MATTPSGYPEVVFVSKGAGEVAGLLANICLSRGYFVEQPHAGQVRCRKQLDGGSAILASLLVGNAYSTPPDKLIEFNIIDIGNKARVQAHMWIETQMVGGQVRTQDMNQPKVFNEVEQAMIGVGGIPPGDVPAEPAEPTAKVPSAEK